MSLIDDNSALQELQSKIKHLTKLGLPIPNHIDDVCHNCLASTPIQLKPCHKCLVIKYCSKKCQVNDEKNSLYSETCVKF